MYTCHSYERSEYGEKSFVYRGYKCRISYNGIRPSFFVDGEKIENLIPEFEVTPDSVGKLNWDNTLMRLVDKYEGTNIESDDYISPSERQRIREFSKRYFDWVLDASGTYKQGHKVYMHYECTWFELKEEVYTEYKNLLEEDTNSVYALSIARNNIFTNMAKYYFE